MIKFFKIMLQKLMDIALSTVGLLLFLPLSIIVALLVHVQDSQNPLFITTRVGEFKKPFRMVKIRLMVANTRKK